MYYHSPSFWPARLIPAPRRELAQSGVGGVRHVKPRRPSSRRWSTEEGRLVLPRVPDGGPAPADNTRSRTGVRPSTCRTRPSRACQRRPRAATSPAALAALSCLLCLTHITSHTSHPTTHHLQEKKKHPTHKTPNPPQNNQLLNLTCQPQYYHAD